MLNIISLSLSLLPPRRRSEKMDCPDSCNFHGLCSGGTCYCQPGSADVAHSCHILPFQPIL